jgi:hypothetical protein
MVTFGPTDEERDLEQLEFKVREIEMSELSKY